jgi:tetratricopeptide (TPR) repeat protein
MRRRLHDFDSAESAFRFRAFTWSLTGLVLGALLGFYYSLQTGADPLRAMVVGGLGLWAFAYFGTLRFAERAGVWGGSIYFSSGSRLPLRREYSLAESLAVRARYDEAAAEYERAAAEYADDPEPCLRLARLLRDSMQRPADAATWFRRGLERAEQGARLGIRRELVELHVHRLGTPEKALPELARIAEDQAGTPTGDWALRELRAIKASLRDE